VSIAQRTLRMVIPSGGKDAQQIEPHGVEQRDIGVGLDLQHRVAFEDRGQFRR
jgi:hypothetical protein